METFLFDFDGTLVDSMPTFASVMIRILDENKISYKSDIVKTITPLGLIGTAEYYISLGIDKTENRAVFHFLDEGNSVFEIFIRLTGESDDDIG